VGEGDRSAALSPGIPLHHPGPVSGSNRRLPPPAVDGGPAPDPSDVVPGAPEAGACPPPRLLPPSSHRQRSDASSEPRGMGDDGFLQAPGARSCAANGPPPAGQFTADSAFVLLYAAPGYWVALNAGTGAYVLPRRGGGRRRVRPCRVAAGAGGFYLSAPSLCCSPQIMEEMGPLFPQCHQYLSRYPSLRMLCVVTARWHAGPEMRFPRRDPHLPPPWSPSLACGLSLQATAAGIACSSPQYGSWAGPCCQGVRGCRRAVVLGWGGEGGGWPTLRSPSPSQGGGTVSVRWGVFEREQGSG